MFYVFKIILKKVHQNDYQHKADQRFTTLDIILAPCETFLITQIVEESYHPTQLTTRLPNHR